MDWIDSFYAALDSEELLHRHGPELAREAVALRSTNPRPLAGLILMPDSHDAVAFRQAFAKVTGAVLPVGVMVALCPRLLVERLLASSLGAHEWREESWQSQSVLPVLVSAPDGIRFGLFELPEATCEPAREADALGGAAGDEDGGDHPRQRLHDLDGLDDGHEQHRGRS
jgi:hypothetical protein